MEVEAYQHQQQHVMVLLHKDSEKEEVAFHYNDVINDSSSSTSTGTAAEAEFPNTVFFDQLNGIWKCRHCDWSYCVHDLRTDHIRPHHCKGAEHSNGNSEIKSNDVTLSASERNSKDVKNIRNFGDKENLIEEMVQQSTENLNNEGSCLTFRAESSKQKCENSKPFDSDIEADDFDILEEIDPDYTEFDVEKVIRKQTTHDLYCPNCNSCITRKVILRRKRLKIRNSRRKPKHDKLEKKIHPEVEAKSMGTPKNLDWADDSTSAENIQALANDDHGHEREADVFRCLSCFSLFIPTGNGFKLFRFFRDDGEKKSMQNPEIEYVSNTNWLFSLFTTDKRSTSAEQGTVNDRGTSSGDAEYQVLNASIEEHKYSENASIDMRSTNETTKAGVDAMNDAIKDNIKQINLPCSSDDKFHQQKNGDRTMSMNGTVLNAPQFAGNGLPMSQPQQVGGGSSVSSTFESLTRNKSDNKLSKSLSQVNPEKISVTVQKLQALQNDQTSFIQGIDAMNDGIKDNIKQINLPCSTDNKLHQHENGDLAVSMNGTVLYAAQFAGNGLPMSQPQQVGGSSSTLESLSRIKSDNKLSESLSQVNLEKNSSVTVQKELALQNGQTSFPQGTTSDADLLLKGESINRSFALTQETPAIGKEKICVEEKALDVGKKLSAGNDVIVVVGTESVEHSSSQDAQDINVPLLAESLPHVSEQRGSGVAIDIVKSIVYGGLIESITSLGVVSSAAGAGTGTLNILALGLANLIGGLLIIAHNLVDLKNDGSRGSSNEVNVEEDRYFEALGRRQNFSVHAVVVIVSYIIFGVLPPVSYGCSFRKSDDKDMKLAVVGASSLVCIMLLSAGKAHVQSQPRSYIRTILYFVSMGIAASGASYVVGDLLGKLLEKEGWFKSSSALSALSRSKTF